MSESSLHKRFKYTETPTGCGVCGGVGCDCLDKATAPSWYAPPGPLIFPAGGLSLSEVDEPERRVRCGYCGNNPYGRNPECNRPIHRHNRSVNFANQHAPSSDRGGVDE